MENNDCEKGVLVQPVSLIKQVSYQEGAVVSRTLIEKEAGTVTLFAFDVGQGLSEHTAPYDALVYLLEGTVEVCSAGAFSRLQDGDAILLPANKPHALKAVERFKMILTMIHS
jgi:quercetin dioxygenase-like cupin family protein